LKDVKLLENRLHGDTLFPIRIYTVDYLDGNVIFNLHWHPEHEFVYIEEGKVNLQVGTKHYHLKSGDCFFICRELLHAAYPIKGNSFKLHAIVFHQDLISSFKFDRLSMEYFEKLNAEFIKSGISINQESAILMCTQLLNSYFNKKCGFELSVKGYIFQLLSEIFSNYKTDIDENYSNEQEHLKLIRIVMDYINKHSHEKIMINELANVIQMSSGHFNRFFKSIVKMTPVTYINMVRINKACELIKNTNKTLTEIALDVGFNNQSYFIRTFKKQKGVLPKVFKNSL
jgi:AraC-like DNA-binding protein